ncbi:MAG TPA: alpha/beta hydrolase [Planctomycetaceae bacterium]|nr:alpha/beta hydrolase [Planctomycetaceae bacterium]
MRRSLSPITACSLAALLALCSAVPLRAADDVSITPDVVYGHKHGLAMTFDVFQPKENANGAGVLFMVSGGWYSVWAPPETALPMFRPLLAKGFTVFSVRHGSSPKFTVPEAVDDVRRAVRFIRLNAERYAVDPERLGVFGGSAGGHLSLILGTTADDGDAQAADPVLRTSNRVAAVAAYFPPTDLREFVKPESPYYQRFPALRFDQQQAPDMSPLLHVSAGDAPTLLVHGDQDELVPIDHSTKIIAALEEHNVPCELVTIEGAAHGFRGDDNRRAVEALIAWFEKHLGEKSDAE